MKRIITAAVLGTALFGAHIQTAQAHDNCTAGAFIGGIFAGAVIAAALQTHTDYYPAPAYCAPPAPVYCQFAPIVYAPPAPVAVCAPTPTVFFADPHPVRFGCGYVRSWPHRHGW